MLIHLFCTLPMFFQEPKIAEGNSKYFVFVGEKISVTRVHRKPDPNVLVMDEEYFAKYRVVLPFKGSYKGKMIEFTAFDHYGVPSFSGVKHALLYVELHEGKYYHSKYMYSPVYRTKNGRWAGPYAANDYDYAREYDIRTKIRPEIIEFAEPVVRIIPKDADPDVVKRWLPEGYYKIEGNKATAIFGNYIEELFLLKQMGVLKARGEFQDRDFEPRS